MEIDKGTLENIDDLEKLYDMVNDYLANGVNYPGWRKGIYPARETAETGIYEGNLFVLKKNNIIAGSFILNHKRLGIPDLVWFNLYEINL